MNNTTAKPYQIGDIYPVDLDNMTPWARLLAIGESGNWLLATVEIDPATRAAYPGRFPSETQTVHIARLRPNVDGWPAPHW